MNFSVIAVLFLVFSIINSVFSSQKKRNQRPRDTKYNQMPPLYKNIANKVQTELEIDEEVQGMVFEDKSKVGSLNYIEIDHSEEGIQTESFTRDLFKEKEKVAEDEDNKEKEFGFNDLQRGIVLAELLGPPRVLKRNIR